MALSLAAIQRLCIALANQDVGNEVASAIDVGAAQDAGSSHTIAAIIVATNVSQTVDFGALKVGDKVVVIPAAAGNTNFVTVATAGTLGQAAVVGSLYVVLRPFVAPAADNYQF